MFEKERKRMIEDQLKGRGILDKAVLNAMEEVERHRFLPRKLSESAYEDRPLSIGFRQTISQPYIVALMTQFLEVNRGDRVLEIGTGSGYQTAILARMGLEVFTVERVPELSLQAEALLDELGYENIHFKTGSGFEGWNENAPYDAIIVTCSPLSVPVALESQLKIGGRMVIPVENDGIQKLYQIVKREDVLEKNELCYVRFVPMLE